MQTGINRAGRKLRGCVCAPGACVCQQRKNKVRVNIISGFLGAGKTTAMNHLLSLDQRRMDVLIREYGRVPVDDRLIKGIPQERIHIFSGVSLHDDPQLLLHDYLHRLAEEDRDELLTDLLIETSGVDMPQSLVQLFMIGYMPDLYELGSFITLVDAAYGMQNLDEFTVALEQVAHADVIVINKQDLATQEEIESLRARLKGINAMARIIVTSQGRMKPEEVLDLGVYRQLRDLRPGKADEAMDEISTLILTEEQPLDKEKLNCWIDALFKEHGDSILRGKGFLSFRGEDTRYVFQSVRKSFHSSSGERWRYGEERKSTIVLIIRRELLELGLGESFADCIADER